MIAENVEYVVRPWGEKDLLQCHAVALVASGSKAWSLSSYESSFIGSDIGFIAVGGGVLGLIVGRVTVGEAEIYDLQVHPEFQGQGVSNQLLTKFLEHCICQNAKRVLLEVRESNARAIAFYQKNNFNEIARREGYYAARGAKKAEAALCLALTL